MILKAAAGGGGRGMRIVHEADELARPVRHRPRGGQKAFGDGSIYLEKYLVEPRHIEFQVFGDRHGAPSTSASASARSSGATRS